MAEFTRDEALAFVGAIRLAISGKVGFRWLEAKLSDLEAYIESVSAENERLNGYIDAIGARDGLESCQAADQGDAAPDSE